MVWALIARPASRSSSQSGSSATTAARLARMVAVALPRLRRSWVLASALRAATGNGSSPRRWPTPRGAVGMPRNVLTAVPPSRALRWLTEGASSAVPGGGEDLGQVDGPGARVQPGQPAADVHQAGTVARGADLGPGGEDAAHLVGQHGRGHVSVLDRERAAETAAHLGGGQLGLVGLPDAEVCCGFGGTFAVKNADESTAMLADKVRGVLGTRAEVCTAGDSSCLMHIGGGLSRLRTGIRT